MIREVFRQSVSVFIVGIMGAVLSPFSVYSAATAYKWRSNASGDWTNSANWDRGASYPQGTNGDSAVFDSSAGSQTNLTNVGSVGNIVFTSDVPRSYTLGFTSPATLGPGALTTLSAILNQSPTSSQTMQFNGAYTLKGDVSGLVNFVLQGASSFSVNKGSNATISASTNTTGGYTATFQNIGSGTATFTGKVTGNGSVVASGPVVLNNTTSDYTGGTTVSGGASVTASQSASGALSLRGNNGV